MKSKDPRYYMPPEPDPKPSIGIGEDGYLYDPRSGLFHRAVSRRGFMKGMALGGVSVFTASCSTVSVVRPEAAEIIPPPPVPQPAPLPPQISAPPQVSAPKPVPPRVIKAAPAAAPPPVAKAPVPKVEAPKPEPIIAPESAPELEVKEAKPEPVAKKAAAPAPVEPEAREPKVPHKGDDFTFALLADAHIFGPINPLMIFRLETAVRQINALEPQPDFVLYCGDLITYGTPQEFDVFDEVMSKLTAKVYYVPGEHDYFLDLGQEFFKRYGECPFAFDHKGVHFIGVNSVVTDDFWTPRNMTPQERMKAGGTLTNVEVQGPFKLGKEQLDWIERDLSKITDKDTPIMLISHAPLFHYYLPWNLWCDDAPDLHALLKPFTNVQVFHGHVHNITEYRKSGIDFHGVLSTSWPHPYPAAFHELGMTGQMPRSNPALPLDGLGWHNVDFQKGEVNMNSILWTLKS